MWTQRLHSGDIPLEEGPPFWCQHAGALGEGIVWEFLSNSVAKLDTWRWKHFLMHLFVSHSRLHFQKVISSMFLPSVKNWFGKIWSRWDMLSSQLCKFLLCLTPKAPSRAPCFFFVPWSCKTLQERLVGNHLPNVELARQGRMLPSISKLLSPIYPDLRDNEKVVADLKKPDCVTCEVFFWNCPHEEEPWRNILSTLVIPVRIFYRMRLLERTSRTTHQSIKIYKACLFSCF